MSCNHTPWLLMTLTMGLTLVGCAAAPQNANDDKAKDDKPALVVTGSRIPHRAIEGKPGSVKIISREGFEEDMRSNQMPHRQGG